MRARTMRYGLEDKIRVSEHQLAASSAELVGLAIERGFAAAGTSPNPTRLGSFSVSRPVPSVPRWLQAKLFTACSRTGRVFQGSRYLKVRTGAAPFSSRPSVHAEQFDVEDERGVRGIRPPAPRAP